VAGAGLFAGNLSLTAQGTLGAGAANVQASCTNEIAAKRGSASYDPTLKLFVFTTLNISGDLDGCAYNDAKATVYNANTNAVLSTQTVARTITSGEAAGGAFSIPLATPVSAEVTPADIRIAVLITSSVTHDAVTSISGTAAYYAIGLSWTAPVDTGGISPTGYKVEYAQDSAGSPGAYSTYVENTQNSSTSLYVGGLTPGVQYWFRITTWNSHGLSAASAQAAIANGVVPYMNAGAPTSVASTAGASGVLNASWTAPGSNGYTPITGYRIEVRWVGDSDIWWAWSTVQPNTGTTATTAAIGGLVPGRSYFVRVATLNAAGQSSYGTSVSATAAGS